MITRFRTIYTCSKTKKPLRTLFIIFSLIKYETKPLIFSGVPRYMSVYALGDTHTSDSCHNFIKWHNLTDGTENKCYIQNSNSKTFNKVTTYRYMFRIKENKPVLRKQSEVVIIHKSEEGMLTEYRGVLQTRKKGCPNTKEKLKTMIQ